MMPEPLRKAGDLVCAVLAGALSSCMEAGQVAFTPVELRNIAGKDARHATRGARHLSHNPA